MGMSIVAMISFLAHCLQYHLFGDNSQLLLFNECCVSFVGPLPLFGLEVHKYVLRGQSSAAANCDHFRWYKYIKVR